jgi:hypothetical protein
VDLGRGPSPARALDLAASEPDVGEHAIVEPLQRVDIAAAGPRGCEALGEPGGAAGEYPYRLRKLAHSERGKGADDSAALSRVSGSCFRQWGRQA